MRKPTLALAWAASAAIMVATAHAAPQSASCAFGSCSAQLTQTTLAVSCDGKPVYSGAFELSSDLQTTQIQATAAGGPQITVQGASLTGTNLASTLTVAGKSTAGTCSVDSNQ